MGKTRKNPVRTGLKPGIPFSRLTPLEYHAAIWLGRGCDEDEIAGRLDVPRARAVVLLASAMEQMDCATLEELQDMFEPDWARFDAPVPESRYERVNNRIVLRGADAAANREAARRKYAEMSPNAITSRLREERIK